MKTERVSDNRSNIVVAAGAATTLVTLAAVYWLGHHGTNVMGWYANYIIPAGALLVGMGCATGYAIAGYYTGIKMTKRLVWSIVGQLVLSYFIAEYEEYRRVVPDGSIGFFAWFDLVTQAFAFHEGGEFGPFGYVMRALEIAGFIAGGVIVPAALRAKPYCEACRTYMRTKPVGVFAGGGGMDNGEETVSKLCELARASDRNGVEKLVAEHGDKKNHRYQVRHPVNLVRCPRCATGCLHVTRHEGHQKELRMANVGQQPLPGEVVRTLFG